MRLFSKIKKLFKIVDFKFDINAQLGYFDIINEIKNDLNNPSSLKIDDVECYLLDNENYEYKISYTCKNGLDMELHFVVYYEYRTENKDILNYLSYSKKYEEFKNKESLRTVIV